jgi:hypothetical protein
VTDADLTSSMKMTGGCACGRVRFSAGVVDDEAYLCHCRMCQRATGCVSVAFKQCLKADVTWDAEPDWYASSPIARRPFCAACGTSLGFEYPDSAKMDLTVAAFDAPERFRCTSHFGVESRLDAWWHGTDGLPEMRADDYDLLTEKWMKAVGKLPD